MPLKNRIVMFVTAVGLGLGMGWVLAAQEQQQKQWKDRAEYDIAVAVDQQKTPQDQLKKLEEWESKYPQSDFADLREGAFLTTYQQMNDVRKTFDMAKKIRERKPEDFNAVSAILQFVYALGNPPPDADLTYAEQTAQYALANLNTIFAASNKPPTVQEAAFTGYRPQMEKLAQRLLAYSAYTKKDYPKAENEIRKYLALDPTQAQFSQMLGQSLFQQRQADPAKQPNALYHFARAATYEGENALPPAGRQQMADYVKNTYVAYHGSDEGLDQLLATAKNNVMPQPGFTIKSAAEIEREKIEADEIWKREHPDLAIWRDVIRGPLTAPDGEMFFKERMEGAGLPAGLNGVMKFTGTIISSTQEKGNTKQIVVGVFDPTVADATLNAVDPLPGMMDPGTMIKFEGTVKSYTREPFNLTFELEPKQIEGWEGKK